MATSNFVSRTAFQFVSARMYGRGRSRSVRGWLIEVWSVRRESESESGTRPRGDRVFEPEEVVDQPAAIGLSGEDFGVASVFDLARARRIAPRLLERAELRCMIGGDEPLRWDDSEREIIERLPAIARQSLQAGTSAHRLERRPLEDRRVREEQRVRARIARAVDRAQLRVQRIDPGAGVRIDGGPARGRFVRTRDQREE